MKKENLSYLTRTNRSSLLSLRLSLSEGNDLLFGIVGLFTAVPIAIFIYFINSIFKQIPETAILLIGIFCIGVITVPASAYLLVRKHTVDTRKLGLILIANICIVLVAIFIFQVSFQVRFPADILSWSESDFVNDILKFRVGYPLYTDQVNNDSFVYPPGTQLLTYFLAWIVGQPTSIPVFRAIQVGYTLLATLMAFLCCEKILKLSSGDYRFKYSNLWGILWLPLLFLMATNILTNPFVQYLHDDASALLITSAALYLLLKYIEERKISTLAIMAVLPALGFWFKQSIAIWIVFYSIHLVIFDRPRSLRRMVPFILTSGIAVSLSLGIGYTLWRENFVYWLFTVLGAHGVSPLRSFQHLLDVWPYVFIGLLGGLVLLRGKGLTTLLSPWLIWLGLILLQIYTSGIAWMINHIGPGSLIAGVWFLAALTRLFPLTDNFSPIKARQPITWLRTLVLVSIIGLLLNGLGTIRIPLQPIPEDAYRYIGEIEKEFEGLPADKILLDAGTWIYLKSNVIMKDRAPTIGERGYSNTGDFSGTLQRIRGQYYSKILVRNLQQPEFWYDHYLWDQSSGIKQALLENYSVTSYIEAVNDPWYMFGEVSILVPKIR